MRLRRRPRPASTLVAFFDTVRAAASAIVAMEASDDLSLIEIMDRVTLTAVERMSNMGLDTSAAAIVIVQSDGADAAAAMQRCQAQCERHGGRDIVCTDDADEGKMMLAARRLALPALEKLGTTLLDDVAVPKPALPAMFARIEQIAAAHGLVIGTFGHAGDGNLHPTIVFEASDAASRAKAQSAFDDIVKSAVELGGTVSGEHGIGSLKQPYLSRMLGETERALSLRIKAAFDPHGILNPGKAI